MKNIGIVSYNIYGNFTNYGSALQSWALQQIIKKIGDYQPILIDYCPKVHLDKNILDPIKKMWDQDEEALYNCRMSLPAIKENYYKFENFFTERFIRTTKKYTINNFEEVMNDIDNLSFVCGSDTIFCIEESKGFDEGYFANFDCMKYNSIAYAASFGDSKFDANEYEQLKRCLKNFKAIGIRENKFLDFIVQNVEVPVARTIDPTLLLKQEDYSEITCDRIIEEKYILLYSRRYNPLMEQYVERIANKNNLKIVEISLRASNVEKGHQMFYNAGVEEFLSLIKHAEYIVTNSFHGMIFSVQFRKQFAVFSREFGDSKINETLELFGLESNLVCDVYGEQPIICDYNCVHDRIEKYRDKSLEFLEKGLLLL